MPEQPVLLPDLSELPPISTRSMQIAVALGVIGGLAIGSWGVRHMFVEGMTDEERRNILMYSGGVGLAIGLVYFADLDKKWTRWLFVDTAGQALEEEMQGRMP